MAAVEVVVADAGAVLEPATSTVSAIVGNPTLLARQCAPPPAAKKIVHRDEGSRLEAESQEDDSDECPPPLREQTSWQLSSGEELPSSAEVLPSAEEPAVAAAARLAAEGCGQHQHQQQQQPARPRAGSSGRLRSRTPPEVKAARAEQREQARELIRPFLESNGFATVKSSRRRLLSFCYPLHVAVEENNPELIQRLLRAGADPFKCDSSGRTPLELAQKLNSKRSHRRAVQDLKRSTRNGKHWIPWLRTADGGLAGVARA